MNINICPKCGKLLQLGVNISSGSTVATWYCFNPNCSCNKSTKIDPQAKNFEILVRCLGIAYKEFCLNQRMRKKIGPGLYAKFEKQWDAILVPLEMDYKLWLAKILDRNDTPDCLKGIVKERSQIIITIEKWRQEFLAHFNKNTLRNFEEWREKNKLDDSLIQGLFNRLIEIVGQYNEVYKVSPDLKVFFQRIKQESLAECDKWLKFFNPT